jgi:hypothetical protein
MEYKKKPRRIVIVAFVILLTVTVFPLIASAASEGDVAAAANRGVTINGKTYHAPSKYVKMLMGYLASNDLTPAQCDKAIAAINGALNSWAQDQAAADAKAAADQAAKGKASSKVKQEIIDDVVEVAEELGAKTGFDGNSVMIVDPAGKTYTLDMSGSPVKNTGMGGGVADVAVVVACILMIGLAVSFAAARKMRLLSRAR